MNFGELYGTLHDLSIAPQETITIEIHNMEWTHVNCMLDVHT